MNEIFSYFLILGIIFVGIFYVFSLVSKNTYIGCTIAYSICFFSLVFFDNMLLSVALGTFFYTLYMSINFARNEIKKAVF